MRRFSKQGRKKALLGAIAILFILYCLYPGSRSPQVTQSVCLKERLQNYVNREKDYSVGLNDFAVKFAGNGYVAVGVENELYFREPGSRVLSLSSSFSPLVNIELPESWSKKSAEITDFEKGEWRRIHCYDIGNDCACIEERIYAHATRPSLVVQDIQIVNPTNNALQVKFSRPNSDKWTNNEPTQSTVTTAQLRNITLNGNIVQLGVICSTVPDSLTILQKREEKFSFICSAEQQVTESQQPDASSKVSLEAVKAFQKARQISSSVLEKEHETAWKELQSTTFYLSTSKAPDVLNGIHINSTRYALLSQVEAKGLLSEESYEDKQTADRLLGQLGKCYTGHSNLLYPSKLWESLKSSAGIQQVTDLWLLTLEKKGCGDLLKSGARGVSKAFVLSLLAATFDQNHLEVGIDPADLHRQMRAFRLPMPGATKALVDVNLHLDEENVNYMLVSSTDQLFACPAGCQDDPVTLSARPIKLPVKVTKPLTSILYVATSRRHLLQLRSAIHVSEVVHAPAHENEVIALHEHGHRLGGLPTSFWIFLGAILIAFHVFLVKLLWTEWRKGDTTPYNPYLRYRYQSQRNH
ncbi:unnamed protein product, partial [Mesorhabditis belari]|uniref:Uncharacterized protein n=1 Tax=Mesorhabditis belari TaxID=2138241 RepID=A0AAF3EQA1_9BILA